MSEDPSELERFYEETVAPLSAYDEQDETDLVKTVEAYLDNDGNVTPTADTMFTTATRSATAWSACASCCGRDISSPRAARSWGWASRRCESWASRHRGARRWSRGRRVGKVRKPKGAE